jgi:hypothetical protein
VSARARVRDYLATHPHARPGEIAQALGLTYEQAKDGRANARAPRPSGVRTRLPTFMVRGEGERRHECALYVDCLAGAAFTLPGDAHCPDPCDRFEVRDHEADRTIAALVPRESWGGAAW